jgi:hypothetical protein
MLCSHIVEVRLDNSPVMHCHAIGPLFQTPWMSNKQIVRVDTIAVSIGLGQPVTTASATKHVEYTCRVPGSNEAEIGSSSYDIREVPSAGLAKKTNPTFT